MCALCSNFFCHDCFFDQRVALAHGGNDQIKELNTLVRTKISELEGSHTSLQGQIKTINLATDPIHKRNLQR